jgi:hypothetical protein
MRLSRQVTSAVTQLPGTHTVRPAGGSPAALPTPNMCVPTGTHSQTMEGDKWLPTDVTRATAKLPFRPRGLSRNNCRPANMCTNTPSRQPCSPCRHYPTALSHTLGLMYDQSLYKRRATSHARAQRQQRPTQHSHHTSTCAIRSSTVAAVKK